MSEDVSTTQTDQSGQTDSPAVEADYKNLYGEEVQNAKKLRARAQDAEAKIQEMLKAQETNKVKQLKENEKYKELYEQTQAKLDEVSPFKEKWAQYEGNKRESLLSQLPEEDRERLANEKLDTLEYITNKLNNNKPPNPKHAPAGKVTTAPALEKPYGEMTESERRAWHENVMKGWGG
tara:strand:+ start:169 stop:702 length:534 start_codon:yes stop_codon:yes gene_type:complete